MYLSEFNSNSISIESIVVPGKSLAISLSDPISELISVDFPALGLPKIAILKLSFISFDEGIPSNF